MPAGSTVETSPLVTSGSGDVACDRCPSERPASIASIVAGQDRLVRRSKYALNRPRASLAHEREEVGADVSWSHLCARGSEGQCETKLSPPAAPAQQRSATRLRELRVVEIAVQPHARGEHGQYFFACRGIGNSEAYLAFESAGTSGGPSRARLVGSWPQSRPTAPFGLRAAAALVAAPRCRPSAICTGQWHRGHRRIADGGVVGMNCGAHHGRVVGARRQSLVIRRPRSRWFCGLRGGIFGRRATKVLFCELRKPVEARKKLSHDTPIHTASRAVALGRNGVELERKSGARKRVDEIAQARSCVHDARAYLVQKYNRRGRAARRGEQTRRGVSARIRPTAWRQQGEAGQQQRGGVSAGRPVIWSTTERAAAPATDAERRDAEEGDPARAAELARDRVRQNGLAASGRAVQQHAARRATPR